MTPFRNAGVSTIVVFLRRCLRYGAVVVVGLLAAACVGLPTDSTWGDVSLTKDTPARIMLAFSDRIVQVDPSTGLPLELLDPTTGKVRTDDKGNARTWIVQSPTGTTVHFYTRPVLSPDNTTLLALTYENKLFQIDDSAVRIMNPPDGTQLAGHNVGNPLLTDTMLYVPISDGGLLALSPTDYSQKWKFSTDKDKGVWAQPLLVDGTLYVSSMDHNLYALDAQTGTVKWHVDLEGAVASTPVFANGALYVGSFGRKIFKI